MRLDPNLEDPDGFYAALVAAAEGLTETQSQDLALRLVFLLANQVGAKAALDACIDEAARPYRKDSTNG
jgi:hypothetical protein